MAEQLLLWLDGQLLPSEQARIPALDHGLTVGDGVFEAVKVVRGQTFALRRHLDRMERSASRLGLTPLDRPLVERAVAELLAANQPQLTGSHDVLRLTWTDGVGPLGSDRASQRQPRLLAAIAQPGRLPATANVIIVPWTRNEHGALVGIKTTSYADNALALDHAHQLGASEALFANTAGMLCEGTGSNVFVAIDGRVLTPPLADGCLDGITRQLLLEHTAACEESIPIAALAQADEIFLTSTRRDVQAVTAINGSPVADAKIGPLTQAAAASFAAIEAQTLEP
jgi:branched-chain amino acid aminotransferase